MSKFSVVDLFDTLNVEVMAEHNRYRGKPCRGYVIQPFPGVLRPTTNRQGAPWTGHQHATVPDRQPFTCPPMGNLES